MQYRLIFANHAVCFLVTVYNFFISVHSLVSKWQNGKIQQHIGTYKCNILTEYMCAYNLGQDLGHAQEIIRQAL